MPLFFQHVIDEETKLALWHITEAEAFFSQHVPLQRPITHPHKRLQHLAGRYLLKYLFPDFPLELIQIADTRKPYLEDEAFHFSISHCGDYAAVIVSRTKRVGVDIELVTPKIERIRHKFLSEEEWSSIGNRESGVVNRELSIVNNEREPTNVSTLSLLTLLWSCKEAAFKWYGIGEVDFKSHMIIHQVKPVGTYQCVTQMLFKKNEDRFIDLHSCFFPQLVLSYVVT